MNDHAPRRRIWLYMPDTDRDAIEITILGPLDDIGHLFALVKSAAERWEGFHRVGFIGSGTTCGVLRASLTNQARCGDPYVEALEMLHAARLPIDLSWHASGVSSIGLVGTW